MSKFRKIRDWLEGFSELRNLLLILFMAAMFVLFRADRAMPEEEWVRVINTTRLYFNLPEDDPAFPVTARTVNAGEEVRILGISKRTKDCGNAFWVETRDGLRGFIGQTAVDDSVYVFDAAKGSAIPAGTYAKAVSVEYGNYDNGEYTVVDQAGTRETVSGDKLVTLTGLKYRKYILLDPTAYMTKDEFEEKYMGKTLAEADKVSLPFKFIYTVSDRGTYSIRTNVYVMDKESRTVARADLRFENGVVTGYSLDGKSLRDANMAVLTVLPAAGAIISSRPLQWLIAKPMYETEYFKPERTFSGILGLLLAAVVGIMFVIWVANVGVVPLMVALALVRIPQIFYPLTNRLLFIFLMLVSLAGIYVWGVLMLFNNYFWWFVLPLSLIVFIVWLRKIDERISERCPKCRRLNTIALEESQVVRQRYEWQEEREVNRILFRSTRKWKTWTRVTYYGGPTYDKDIKHHTETTTTAEYNMYKVKYRVDTHENIYRCRRPSCRYEYRRYPETYHRVDKKFTGTTVDTSTRYDVD